MSQTSILIAALAIVRSWTGRRVRHLREKRGYTAKEVGIVLGFKPDSAKVLVHNIETGKRKLSLQEIVELASLEEEDKPAKPNLNIGGYSDD